MISLPQGVDEAWEQWGANCGPVAIAAATGRALPEVRAALGEDWPGRTSVRAARLALAALGVPHRLVRRRCYGIRAVRGIVRVQFLDERGTAQWGHWTEASKNTHFVAVEGGLIADTLTWYHTGDREPVDYAVWACLCSQYQWAPHGLEFTSLLWIPT